MTELLTPPEGALIVSPSQLDNWQLCNYRELYRGHPEYDGRSNEAPGFGTGMHALIAAHNDGRPVLTEEDAMSIWLDAMLHHPKHPEDITQYASPDRLWSLVHEMLFGFQAWRREVLPLFANAALIMSEQTMARHLGEIEGTEVWVQGTVDAVYARAINSYVSVDWKTAGQGWKRGKAEAGVQHIMYPWLAEPVLGTMPTQGMYVVYDRKKREWTWADKIIALNPWMVTSALEMMMDMARGLYFGIGTASPTTRGGFGDGRGWHCKAAYCPAWNFCTFKNQIDDKWLAETKPAVPVW